MNWKILKLKCKPLERHKRYIECFEESLRIDGAKNMHSSSGCEITYKMLLFLFLIRELIFRKLNKTVAKIIKTDHKKVKKHIWIISILTDYYCNFTTKFIETDFIF